jgi:hypothetical protein
MEAFFIALMAAVVLLTGYVSLVVLYKLFRANNGAVNRAGSGVDKS